MRHRSNVLRFAARRATLSRSVGLLRTFPDEQADPDTFYSNLADDTVTLVGDLWQGLVGRNLLDRVEPAGASRPAEPRLADTLTLDIGGGPGYFSDAFADAGSTYVSVEPDVGEMAAAGLDQRGSVRGSGMALPVRDDAVDICLSSNVAEHVPRPWDMGEEMLRVTRPGGLTILSYTLWWGPFGGHEMGLTHYLGGHRSRRLYERRHGHRPKNYFGESLFRVGCAEGLRWAESTPRGELLAAFPRYHPSWAWWMVEAPVVREVAVSNLVLVFRATGTAEDVQ